MAGPAEGRGTGREDREPGSALARDAGLLVPGEKLEALASALGAQLLTSGSTAPDSLDAEVVFDDGSIQDWADATFGDGLVRVTSALVPAS